MDAKFDSIQIVKKIDIFVDIRRVDRKKKG